MYPTGALRFGVFGVLSGALMHAAGRFVFRDSRGVYSRVSTEQD